MKQFEVYTVCLDPTIGAEMKKTKPVVIISPNEMNDNLRTIMIAPITNSQKSTYPTRIKVKESNFEGFIVLDQIRTIDKTRCIHEIGQISNKTIKEVKKTLQEMFL